MNNVLILGAKGMLGGQLMKLFSGAVGWDRGDVNVLEFEALKKKILALERQPEAIINCVAFNDVDGAEDNPAMAMALNAEFVGNLAALAKVLGIPLVHFSSNYVFDGRKGEYAEDDQPNPLSAYGQSKYMGEQALMKNTDMFYLVRTAVLFGPKGESELSKRSFVEIMVKLSEKQAEIKAVNDEINSITLVTDLAQAVKYLLNEKIPYGIYHVTNDGSASWYDIAKEIFYVLKKDIKLIPVAGSEFQRKAIRPKKSVLINTKLYHLQPWPDAVKEHIVREYLTKAN